MATTEWAILSQIMAYSFLHFFFSVFFSRLTTQSYLHHANSKEKTLTLCIYLIALVHCTLEREVRHGSCRSAFR